MTAWDPPASIAILGAGPIGLEAALYARFLGYRVSVFERGDIAQNVREWSHCTLWTPFRMNATSLGLQALQAQSSNYCPPHPETFMPAGDWVSSYLVPLAQSDLLTDSVFTQTEVVHVRRHAPGNQVAEPASFELNTRRADGSLATHRASVLIDASGTFHEPLGMGPHGEPAFGEADCHDVIEYGVPDVVGTVRSQFADRQTLVVGHSRLAATTIVSLAELAKSSPRTRAVWISLLPSSTGQGPFEFAPNRSFRQPAELLEQANRLALAVDGPVEYVVDAEVASVQFEPSSRTFSVNLTGPDHGVRTGDHLVANVGFAPDPSFSDQLNVECCPRTRMTTRLASRLQGGYEELARCDLPSFAPDDLITSVEDYYVLGGKSYGLFPHFMLRYGHEQIRQLFTLIGDRSTLDLYRCHVG